MNTTTIRHIRAGRPVRADCAMQREDLEEIDEKAITSEDNTAMLLVAVVVLLPIAMSAIVLAVRYLLTP